MAKREEALRDVNNYLNVYERASDLAAMLCVIILVLEEALEDMKTTLNIEFIVCLRYISCLYDFDHCFLQTYAFHKVYLQLYASNSTISSFIQQTEITYVFFSPNTQQDTCLPEYHELVWPVSLSS